MLSALTLLRAEGSHLDRDRWSYPALAEELRRVCAQPRLDAPELFRRMTFNALISNLDDHPRNHAVIAMNQDWKLSPAYAWIHTELKRHRHVTLQLLWEESVGGIQQVPELRRAVVRGDPRGPVPQEVLAVLPTVP